MKMRIKEAVQSEKRAGSAAIVAAVVLLSSCLLAICTNPAKRIWRDAMGNVVNNK